MMLSKRMTAKSLELNPARQARKRMLNDSKDCQPAGCDSPPDRPPLPAPVAAAAGAGPARLLPCAAAELPELVEALCLPSVAAWCSAISERGVGCLLSGRPSLPALRCLPPPLRNSRQTPLLLVSCAARQPLTGIQRYATDHHRRRESSGCAYRVNSVSLLGRISDTSRKAHSRAT